MRLDPAFVARVQFAFTVTFHIIFPTISIGLAAFLVVVEGLWLRTKAPIYLQIYRFWLGIFAMSFGVGVVMSQRLSCSASWSRRCGYAGRDDSSSRAGSCVHS
jgi:cytochrome d ubiquinol oxidase subunit I